MLILKIILGLFSLSILILVHELGHFIAARLSGVEVITFSIGFGKKWFVRQIGKTEFALSVILLGGYCRFKGEQNFIQSYESKLNEIPREEGSLFSADPWKRILIALAGPLSNIALSLILLLSISWITYTEYTLPPRIVLASDYDRKLDRPANLFGLETGDVLLSIDEKKINSYQDMEQWILVSPEQSLHLEILRDQKTMQISITPLLNKETGTGIIGVYPYIDNIITKDFYISETSMIPEGSRIIEYSGQDIQLLTDLFPLFGTDSKENSLTYIDPDGLVIETSDFEKDIFELNLPIPYSISESDPLSFSEGVSSAIDRFKMYIELSFKSLAMLFKGIDVVNSMMGPLRAPVITGEITIAGFQDGFFQGIRVMVSFLAPLSIALAIINLLPIPALDGGQIILFFVDWFKRKPLKPIFIFRYQFIGSIIVLCLMFFSVSIDILYFFRS